MRLGMNLAYIGHGFATFRREEESSRPAANQTGRREGGA